MLNKKCVETKIKVFVNEKIDIRIDNDDLFEKIKAKMIFQIEKKFDEIMEKYEFIKDQIYEFELKTINLNDDECEFMYNKCYYDLFEIKIHTYDEILKHETFSFYYLCDDEYDIMNNDVSNMFIARMFLQNKKYIDI